MSTEQYLWLQQKSLGPQYPDYRLSTKGWLKPERRLFFKKVYNHVTISESFKQNKRMRGDTIELEDKKKAAVTASADNQALVLHSWQQIL